MNLKVYKVTRHTGAERRFFIWVGLQRHNSGVPTILEWGWGVGP